MLPIHGSVPGASGNKIMRWHSNDTMLRCQMARPPPLAALGVVGAKMASLSLKPEEARGAKGIAKCALP